MKVLITNDDGYNAAGIRALADAFRRCAEEVVVVAPDRERSAAGHALTLHHPLRAAEVSPGIFAVDGTPTDCINLGIHNLIGFKPDLVVSGVNHGANLGDDITYSGTVSAAMEAMLMGIPGIAVSLACKGPGAHFEAAAEFAASLAEKVAAEGLPPDTFLNVNVPDLPAEEVRRPLITRQGKRKFEGAIIDKIDPRGRKYYWIGTSEMAFLDLEGTDYHAVTRGHISVTPLHLDLTNYASLETLRAWKI